jgi:glycosyltransferase involved in cell wall biosynthesis
VKLLVVSAAYPAPSDPSRAVFIETLTRAQAAAGLSVSVVAPRVTRSDPPCEQRRGIDVRRFSYPGGGRRMKEVEAPSLLLLVGYALSSFACVARQLIARRPDCVLCHWVLPTGPATALAAAILRVPLVLVAHGSDINTYARRSGFFRALVRWTLLRARRVLAVSRVLEDTLVVDFDLPPTRVGWLPMGVDGSLFLRPRGNPKTERRDARRTLGLEVERRTVLFVGDLVTAKGVKELLAAWRLLEKRGVDAQLVLAGDGPLRIDTTTKNGNRAPRFIGRVNQGDLARWYRAADLVVLPSHGEGMPVSLMEALQCGVPVVATTVGGIPELLEHGRLGRLVPPGDSAALARGLGELLTDDALRAKLCERLLELAPDRFTASGRARALTPYLEEACCGT